MSFHIKFDQESVKHVAHDRKTIGHWWTFNLQFLTPEIKWDNNIIPYGVKPGFTFKADQWTTQVHTKGCCTIGQYI